MYEALEYLAKVNLQTAALFPSINGCCPLTPVHYSAKQKQVNPVEYLVGYGNTAKN